VRGVHSNALDLWAAVHRLPLYDAGRCTQPRPSASPGTAKWNPSKEPVDLNYRPCNASSRETVGMPSLTVLNHRRGSL
jgi:hypothetical protein